MADRRTFLHGLASLPLAGTSLAAFGTIGSVDAVPAPAASTVEPVDAVIIAFASRTVALARRQNEVLGRKVDAEGALDSWNFANRPHEPIVAKARSKMVMTDLSTATHRIMQFSDPLDDGAQDEADLVYEQARKAHKRAVAERMDQSRVPYLTKMSDRMWQRLIRWVEQLTDMKPTTLAGLAAKALVIDALSETDSDIAEWWGQNLGRSLADDAIRLHASVVVA